MAVFIDTSAFYACLDGDDKDHEAATQSWRRLEEASEDLFTSNYVLVETIALLGNRLGFQAVRDFEARFMPLLQIHWIDESVHRLAMAALLTAGRRKLSLVDCTSFEVMRRLGLEKAVAFDPHFGEQGFTGVA